MNKEDWSKLLQLPDGVLVGDAFLNNPADYLGDGNFDKTSTYLIPTSDDRWFMWSSVAQSWSEEFFRSRTPDGLVRELITDKPYTAEELKVAGLKTTNPSALDLVVQRINARTKAARIF